MLGTEKSSHDIYIFLLTQHSVFREMWALEYEVDELQHKFADSIGKMDLDNLDVDFIEDMMLKAKPLQTVLNDIRNRQIVSFVVEKLIYIQGLLYVYETEVVFRFQSPGCYNSIAP